MKQGSSNGANQRSAASFAMDADGPTDPLKPGKNTSKRPIPQSTTNQRGRHIGGVEVHDNTIEELLL